jgi:hypothetical protein
MRRSIMASAAAGVSALFLLAGAGAANAYPAPSYNDPGWSHTAVCPSNTHVTIYYTVLAGKQSSLWVGRDYSEMINTNVQAFDPVAEETTYAYSSSMNGVVYWGHGSGLFTGAVKDQSSYATCEPGV